MIPEADDKLDLSLTLPYKTQQAIALHAVATGQSVDEAFGQMVYEGMQLLARRAVPARSRNQREGHYAGQFRPNGHAELARRHRRQPYGIGQYVTLKEYARLRKRADRLGVVAVAR